MTGSKETFWTCLGLGLSSSSHLSGPETLPAPLKRSYDSTLMRMACSATTQPLSLFNSQLQWLRFARPTKRRWVVTMRDRSNNPRPLQKGRNLSIEAIQTVQTLKRSNKDHHHLEQAFNSKFRRLLKLDMMSVLRELLRQNECVLALKVFEEIRREIWYKPHVLLYSDMIQVLGSNGFVQEVELLHLYLKNETNLKPEVEGFNALLRALLGLSFIELAMECYYLMKQVGCEPDRLTFRILVNGLESMGETAASGIVRMDAQKYYGESLDFLEEEKEEFSLKPELNYGGIQYMNGRGS